MDSNTILDLCDRWHATVVQPDGSGRHDAKSRRLTLLVQGCVFEEIDVEAMQAACVGLTDRLHYRNAGQYIDNDQQHFWQWTARLLSSEDAKTTIGADIHSHLVDLVFPTLFCEEDPFLSEPQQPDPRFNRSVKKLVRSRARLLSYLTFPLLEAVARANCSAHLATNGLVVNAFTIDGRSYSSGQRCSSLKHVLMLAERLSSGSFAEWHRRMESVIHRITPDTPLYSAIYGWRNELLHGNEFVAIKNRVILNIAILFLLEFCRNDYETLRQSAVSAS